MSRSTITEHHCVVPSNHTRRSMLILKTGEREREREIRESSRLTGAEWTVEGLKQGGASGCYVSHDFMNEWRHMAEIKNLHRESSHWKQPALTGYFKVTLLTPGTSWLGWNRLTSQKSRGGHRGGSSGDSRAYLPSIVMHNVTSLDNKAEELEPLERNVRDLCECSVSQRQGWKEDSVTTIDAFHYKVSVKPTFEHKKCPNLEDRLLTVAHFS